MHARALLWGRQSVELEQHPSLRELLVVLRHLVDRVSRRRKAWRGPALIDLADHQHHVAHRLLLGGSGYRLAFRLTLPTRRASFGEIDNLAFGVLRSR